MVENELPQNTFIAVNQSLFQLDFWIYGKDNIRITKDDVVVSDTAYNVVFGTANNSNGGRVQFVSNVTGKIVITRVTPLERTFDYSNSLGNIKADVLNDDFDRIWRSVQEVSLDIENIRDNHDLVTSTDDGFMSAADKVKLDGVATGATANSSDSFLLNRGNHTGAYTGLATVATSGSYVDLTGKPDIVSTPLTGLNVVNGTVNASDTILGGIGKLQGQLTKYKQSFGSSVIINAAPITAMVFYPILTATIPIANVVEGRQYQFVSNVEFATTTESTSYIPYLKINGVEVLHGDRQNIVGHTTKRQNMTNGYITVESGKLQISIPTIVSFMSTGLQATHGIWGEINTPVVDVVVEFGIISYAAIATTTITRKPSYIVQI